MNRVETRELAYFLAVAQESHIGRAAERLGIAQPPLSRAVRALERRLGVELLVRHAGGVRLTPAGEVLAREAAEVLAAADAAVRRTRRAAEQRARLLVALKPGGDGELLPEILAHYQAGGAAVPVELVFCDGAERVARLRDGTVDAALLHHPYDDLTDLDVEPLLVEASMALLPAGHRLADRQRLLLADLAEEPLARWRGLPEYGGTGPEVHGITQLTQLVALGQAVGVVPESVRQHVPGGVVCVPVDDARPITLLLAWPQRSTSPTLAAFAAAAATVAASRLPGSATDVSVPSMTAGSAATGHARNGSPASA
ncbi:LysR family transcriptional regulator [Kitasatospora viridis]|uniref:LysR family transcriptional regulator n=1 Tax=Kitasatospora viridis TaxID=281105 RepID=A0A561TTJ7_9ACTN|nr:LysR family transcriptional regulator [Kitasatospora viridis]TWF90449.1 LysR family transcriptional regulator [Kitasatospora viridis]